MVKIMYQCEACWLFYETEEAAKLCEETDDIMWQKQNEQTKKDNQIA